MRWWLKEPPRGHHNCDGRTANCAKRNQLFISFTYLSHIFHKSFTYLSQIFHKSFTNLSHIFHKSFTNLSQIFHKSFTYLSHIFHKSFTNIINKSFLYKLHILLLICANYHPLPSITIRQRRIYPGCIASGGVATKSPHAAITIVMAALFISFINPTSAKGTMRWWLKEPPRGHHYSDGRAANCAKRNQLFISFTNLSQIL